MSVCLPATKEELERVKRTLGIDCFAEAAVTKVSFSVPYIDEHIPTTGVCVEDANELAWAIEGMQCEDGELLKYLSVLSVEQPGTMQEALRCAMNLDDYGYVVDTEHYRYCLRCTPSPGDYQGYLYCYNLRQQQMAQQAKPVGRVIFADGSRMDYTDTQEYLRCIQEELPQHSVTGFRYETLTDDPVVRKQVDDILFDLYGEENPQSLADYENGSDRDMKMGGM